MDGYIAKNRMDVVKLVLLAFENFVKNFEDNNLSYNIEYPRGSVYGLIEDIRNNTKFCCMDIDDAIIESIKNVIRYTNIADIFGLGYKIYRLNYKLFKICTITNPKGTYTSNQILFNNAFKYRTVEREYNIHNYILGLFHNTKIAISQNDN